MNAVENSPYTLAAFEFVNRGLNYTTRNTQCHVTGQELSHGLREYAVERYGPLARFVLERAGIRNTRDFGNIVYICIEHKLMSSTEEDHISDFDHVFDFNEAFPENISSLHRA